LIIAGRKLILQGNFICEKISGLDLGMNSVGWAVAGQVKTTILFALV
jgi:hypothetical protein